MTAYHLPLKVQKIALRVGFPGVALQKRAVVPIGDKADILTVPFPGVDKAIFLSNFPNLRFCQITQRELDMGQLLLIEAGQKVSLILGGIGGFIQ